jgi:hypothetical protein
MLFLSKSKYCFGWDVHIIWGENKRIVNRKPNPQWYFLSKSIDLYNQNFFVKKLTWIVNTVAWIPNFLDSRLELKILWHSVCPNDQDKTYNGRNQVAHHPNSRGLFIASSNQHGASIRNCTKPQVHFLITSFISYMQDQVLNLWRMYQSGVSTQGGVIFSLRSPAREKLNLGIHLNKWCNCWSCPYHKDQRQLKLGKSTTTTSVVATHSG